VADLQTAEAIALFEICQAVANRTRVDDEDDRHDFALKAFENFFAVERPVTTREYMWAFAQATVSGLVKTKRRLEMKLVRESACVTEDGESYFAEVFLPSVGACHETVVDAGFWADRMAELSDHHLETISTLADGGSLLDVCNSRDIRPNDAIRFAKFARNKVRDFGCRNQLERLRWAGRPECVECGGQSAWKRDAGRYECSVCGLMFNVLSKSPLSKFYAPWSGSDVPRMSDPHTRLCQAIEIIAKGDGPAEIEAALEMPYLIAFEIYGAIRDTAWLAPLTGLQPIVAQLDRAPGSEPEGRRFESRRAVQYKPKARPVTIRRRPVPDHEITKIGDWEQEELEFLRKAWAENYSGSEIARELGRSRSAVLGKVHRLGLIKIVHVKDAA
jgi:hypothetical protein